MFSAASYQSGMFAFLERALHEIGPRESCSPAERRLGEMLQTEWSRQGHEVRSQAFTCHPRAFLGFLPISTLLYLAATILYWVSPLIAAIAGGLAAAMIWFELVRYRELVDPLFPAETGQNVYAIVPPAGEVRRRVVVAAHQDSAYEFNLWYFLGNASIPISLLGFVAVLLVFGGSLAKLIAGADNGSTIFNLIGFAAMGLYPVVGLNLFFHTYNVVPGAMDDLAGISVLAGAGQALADLKQSGIPLQTTEVVLLACSAEEAGLRGAKRFVEIHGPQLLQGESYDINVDGIYDERHLTVVTAELTTGARHDPRLVALAEDCAGKQGWPIQRFVIPLGATDATPFALAGIPSVTLLCQETRGLAPNYHTRLDTLEHVRPQSLTVTLQLVIDMIRRLDEGELSRAD